jgi:hypothetical protein
MIGLRPTHVNKGAGFVAIDNALEPSGDTDLSLGVDELAQFRVAPRIKKNKPLIHFGAGYSHIKLTPLDANEVAGVVRGNEITFASAWGGADLRYALGGHILHKDILLGKGHPAQFQFECQAAGVDFDKLESADFRILDPLLTRGDITTAIPLKWTRSVANGKVVLTCELPKGDWSGWTLDPTLTLQPNATDGIDTLIHVGVPTANMGISPSGAVGVDNARNLIQPVLTGLPSGVLISTATWTLYCSVIASASANNISAHRGLTQWYEGYRNYGVPPVGEDGSTWNLRNNNGSVAWAGGAGGGSGSDYTATPTATTAVTAVGYYDWIVTADVAAWNGGTSNFGNWFIGDTPVWKHLCLSDHATAEYRPKLVIVYTLPGGGGIFQSSVMRSAIHGGTMVR